jgi:hypothetical protein
VQRTHDAGAGTLTTACLATTRCGTSGRRRWRWEAATSPMSRGMLARVMCPWRDAVTGRALHMVGVCRARSPSRRRRRTWCVRAITVRDVPLLSLLLISLLLVLLALSTPRRWPLLFLLFRGIVPLFRQHSVPRRSEQLHCVQPQVCVGVGVSASAVVWLDSSPHRLVCHCIARAQVPHAVGGERRQRPEHVAQLRLRGCPFHHDGCVGVALEVVSCGVLSCRVVWCAVPCHAVPCRAVPCRAVPGRAGPYRVVSCRAVSYRTVPCRVVLCVDTRPCCYRH